MSTHISVIYTCSKPQQQTQLPLKQIIEIPVSVDAQKSAERQPVQIIRGVVDAIEQTRNKCNAFLTELMAAGVDNDADQQLSAKESAQEDDQDNEEDDDEEEEDYLADACDNLNDQEPQNATKKLKFE